MNEETAYFAVMLRRFFTRFRTFTYRDVEIGKFVYYQFLANSLLAHWDLSWAKRNLPGIEEELAAVVDAEVHDWTDEPYAFDAHPGGTVLMRAGFGDIAAQYLPPERYYLLSPGQAEVDTIKLNRPDLVAHNIETLFQPNPTAVAALSAACARIVGEHPEDPILGSTLFRDWLLGCLPDLVVRFDAVQRLIEELNVGAVLTISAIDQFCSALNLVARANRIPSITLQHGLIIDDTLFCHVPVLATKKAVWGPATRDWYGHYGVPPTRLRVTGSPRFDVIHNQPWGGKEKLRRILGLGPEWRIAVHATEGLPEARAIKVTGAVIEGLCGMENLFLLILMHPGEPGRLDLYRRMASAYRDCRVERFGHISLYEALSGADVFLTCYSTSALEAMLFQVPVVTVEPFVPIYSYGDLGACQRVRTAGELRQIAGRILGEDDFRRQAVDQSRPFLERYCLPDGSSSARLMREVEELCNQGGVC